MAEEKKINVLKIEIDESVDNLKKLKSEIKKLKSVLLGLDESSEQYKETLSQLADAQFKLKDIQEKSQRAMMDTGEILANVSGLAGTATSAMAGFQAILQLIGDESDEMQKLTQNVISLMAVAQSFSALEDSIDRIKNLKIALAGATKGVSKLKLALGGLGVGVAVAAIGVLIGQLSKLNEKTKETKQHFSDLADAIAEDRIKFEMLQTAWKNLGDDIEAKEQFIIDNKEKFTDLGYAVLSVVDAEKLLVKNSSAVIGAIEARADAEIYYEDLVEKRKAKLEADAKYQYHKDNGHLYKQGWANEDKIKANQEYDEALKLYEESQKKMQELNKTIDVATASEDENTESVNENNTAVKEKIKNLKELREQALVWLETEEELTDDTPKIETENDDFKYENLTDNDYYNQAVATAQAVGDAEIEIALATSERLNEIDEERKEKRLATTRSTIDGFMMISSSTSQLLSAIESTMDTSSKKVFENSKKLQIAQSTVSYLQGLVSAWSSSMQLGPIAGPIAGATLSALLTATYGVNVSKIKSTKFGGTTSASSTNVPNINSSAINALNKPNIGNTRLTFSEGDIENLPQQKVYVLASDIEEATTTRRVTVKNSTF